MITNHRTLYNTSIVVTLCGVIALGLLLIKPVSYRDHRPAVIFDLGGVLFTSSITRALQYIGPMSILKYVLSGHSPFRFQEKAWALLHKASAEQPRNDILWPTYNGTPLPTILVKWQQGLITNDELHAQLMATVEKLDREHYFVSATEKKLIVRSIQFMVDPLARTKATKQLHAGINLLKQYKQAGYEVYALSNMDTPTMNMLLEKYPDIFAQFDGIVHSAGVKKIKPNKDIYQHLLTTYRLNPAQCFFLDNQQENIDAAQELGIPSMLCTIRSMKNLSKFLRTQLPLGIQKPVSLA